MAAGLSLAREDYDAFAGAFVEEVALHVEDVQLQALDASELAARAERQHAGAVQLEALRGEVRDRHGTLLAGSALVESVAASPRRIVQPSLVAKTLAPELALADRRQDRRRQRQIRLER